MIPASRGVGECHHYLSVAGLIGTGKRNEYEKKKQREIRRIMRREALFPRAEENWIYIET
jgi:hypothetical protein